MKTIPQLIGRTITNACIEEDCLCIEFDDQAFYAVEASQSGQIVYHFSYEDEFTYGDLMVEPANPTPTKATQEHTDMPTTSLPHTTSAAQSRVGDILDIIERS